MGQEGDGQVALRAGAGPAPDRRVGGGHCAMTGLVFALFLRLEKFAARNGKTAERAFKAGAVGLGGAAGRETFRAGSEIHVRLGQSWPRLAKKAEPTSSRFGFFFQAIPCVFNRR